MNLQSQHELSHVIHSQSHATRHNKYTDSQAHLNSVRLTHHAVSTIQAPTNVA